MWQMLRMFWKPESVLLWWSIFKNIVNGQKPPSQIFGMVLNTHLKRLGVIQKVRHSGRLGRGDHVKSGKNCRGKGEGVESKKSCHSLKTFLSPFFARTQFSLLYISWGSDIITENSWMTQGGGELEKKNDKLWHGSKNATLRETHFFNDPL